MYSALALSVVCSTIEVVTTAEIWKPCECVTHDTTRHDTTRMAHAAVMGANVVEVIDEAPDVGAKLGLPLPSLLEELFVCEALKQLVVNQRELPRQHLRLDLHVHTSHMSLIICSIYVIHIPLKKKCKCIY